MIAVGLRLCVLSISIAAGTGAMPVRAQILQPDTIPLNEGGSGALFLPDPVPAQDSGPTVTTAPRGAVLRWLDKMSGQVADLALAPGGGGLAGTLTVTLGECRYPVEDPASNAYAFLTIQEKDAAAPIFAGWMIADSPALNVLDHPRYDVWLLHCEMTSDGEATRP